MPAASTTSAGQNPSRADTVRCAAVGSKPCGTNIAPRSRRMPDRWWRLLRPQARENNRSANPRIPEHASIPRRPHDVCHRSPLHRVRSPASRQCTRHAAYNARVSTRAADSRVRSRTKACNLSAARGITTINAPPDRYWMPPSPRHRYDGQSPGSSPRRIVRRLRSRDRRSARMTNEGELRAGCVGLLHPDRPQRSGQPRRLA